ncbi:C1 family peptidase [Mycoplasma miroungirhinis]|uniref:Aminopeptidase n=1 Tax=Mycoplasma miroungirhinis TaxID=754516 RepID=A0A6M4JDP2_9MOLU|nr:C1 family peptidase [Mycoplasma miroungirhinis]QJR44197.1 C1 family peptidase [Mycoplasma miroungirhinis]
MRSVSIMKNINNKLLKKFKQSFNKNQTNHVIANAIAKNGIKNASFNNDILKIHNNVFSHEIQQPSITNQQSSGRCWIFASLNMARLEAMKNLNIEDLELSQSYLYFYDKLEKVNNFLENVIQNGLNLDFNDPLFKYLMDSPADDGGFWEWFLGLINKYGIVPKYLMDDTFDAKSSREFIEILNTKAKECASKIIKASKNNASEQQLRKLKIIALNDIYNIASKTLGIPPEKFDFQYRDKDKKIQKIKNITPLEFYKKYIGDNVLNNKVNLVSDPRKIHPYGKVLSSKYFNSVYESPNNLQLNVPMKELIEATKKSILDGVSVPFACDVSKFHDRKSGIMDLNVYDYNNTLVYLNLNREQRLNLHQSLPTHLMNIVGVDIDSNGNIIKWKVENSWGEDIAFKGIFSMSNDWFKEYNYQCVVDKKYVQSKYLKGLEQEHIILDYTDPLAYLH